MRIRSSILPESICGVTGKLSRVAFFPILTVIFCGVARAVKPLGRFSMVKGTSTVPSVACVKSAVTLNLRVLSCISLAKVTRLDPVKNTVTSELKPLIKYCSLSY